MSAEDAAQPLASDIRAGAVWYVGCNNVTGEPCMVRQDRGYYSPQLWDVVPVVPKSALDAERSRADAAELESKSTADELRRLRENNAAMHRSLTALFHANASGDERDVNEAVEFAGIVLNRIAVQAAQPARAERSENAT